MSSSMIKEQPVGMGDPVDHTTPPPLNNHHYFKVANWCDLIYSQPLGVFRKNAFVFLTIALFASGLRALLALVFDAINGDTYGAIYGTEADVSGFDYTLEGERTSSGQTGIDVATYVMSFANAVILYIVSCLADGATVQVVSEMYAGQNSDNPVVAFGTVAYKAIPLVGSCLLISTCLTTLFLMLIPISFAGRPGGLTLVVLVWMGLAVYVSLISFVVYPAIVVEHHGIFGSISRSITMTQGHLCKIFTVLLIYSLAKAAFSILVVAATFQFEATGSRGAWYTRCVLSFCVNTLWIALRSILKAVLYFNIRISDEGLTQDKLCQEMGLLNAYTEMNENSDSTKASDDNNNTANKKLSMDDAVIVPDTPAADSETNSLNDKEVL